MNTTRHAERETSHHDAYSVTTHTRDRIRRRTLLALPTAAVVAALIGPPALASAPTPATGAFAPASAQAVAGSTSQGIIMRDGGICDPVRHIGC